MAIPFDGTIEAEYSDGYIHSETKLGDVSPYDGIHNVFNDILEKRPEGEHGKMVRFSVFHKNERHDIDFQGLPDNARPIRLKHMQMISGSDNVTVELLKHDFGYQYNDPSGKNIKEIKELI